MNALIQVCIGCCSSLPRCPDCGGPVLPLGRHRASVRMAPAVREKRNLRGCRRGPVHWTPPRGESDAQPFWRCVPDRFESALLQYGTHVSVGRHRSVLRRQLQGRRGAIQSAGGIEQRQRMLDRVQDLLLPDRPHVFATRRGAADHERGAKVPGCACAGSTQQRCTRAGVGLQQLTAADVEAGGQRHQERRWQVPGRARAGPEQQRCAGAGLGLQWSAPAAVARRRQRHQERGRQMPRRRMPPINTRTAAGCRSGTATDRSSRRGLLR